jgi:hypothetical protein
MQYTIQVDYGYEKQARRNGRGARSRRGVSLGRCQAGSEKPVDLKLAAAQRKQMPACQTWSAARAGEARHVTGLCLFTS